MSDDTMHCSCQETSLFKGCVHYIFTILLKERNCETRKNVNFDSFSITHLTSVDCFRGCG